MKNKILHKIGTRTGMIYTFEQDKNFYLVNQLDIETGKTHIIALSNDKRAVEKKFNILRYNLDMEHLIKAEAL